MSALQDHYTLSNGVEIPAIGFGTWQIRDEQVAYNSVVAALAAGYRHVDTARVYGNEVPVGRAVRDSGIPRDEIFVTTKLQAKVKDYEGAKEAFEISIDALGLDYVDLYLIHAPSPTGEEPGANYAEGNAAAWKAMEELYVGGRIRSIGVSNFEVDDLERLIAASRIVPMVNQIEFYIGFTEEEITTYCQSHGILVEAYSPLATGKVLHNPDLAAVAERYGKSVAQLCIRYVLQRGALPLPKSVTPSRIAENADVDFEISPEDMDVLNKLTNTADEG